MSEKITVLDTYLQEYHTQLATEAAYEHDQIQRISVLIKQHETLLTKLQEAITEHTEAYQTCMGAIEGHNNAIKTYYQLISA